MKIWISNASLVSEQIILTCVIMLMTGRHVIQHYFPEMVDFFRPSLAFWKITRRCLRFKLRSLLKTGRPRQRAILKAHVKLYSNGTNSFRKQEFQDSMFHKSWKWTNFHTIKDLLLYEYERNSLHCKKFAQRTSKEQKHVKLKTNKQNKINKQPP